MHRCPARRRDRADPHPSWCPNQGDLGMKYTGSTYSLSYDPLDQQINFDGILRLADADEIAAVFKYLARIHDQVQGALRLSFRRLRYINAEGMRALSMFVAFARGRDTLT